MATTKRQRQKEARRQKMEELERQNKRRHNLRRGVIALVIAVVVVGSAALFFQKSNPPTVTIPTTTAPTTTTTGAAATLSKTCSTTAFAVTGFAPIPCASPAGTSTTAPTMVIPTTAPPTAMEAADLIKGTGATLKTGDKITAQYVLGDYATHKILQSSWSTGPFSSTLALGSLIPGWVQGLPGMKVGGRRELIIPPALAYGASGQSGIPGNDTLVFIVDLVKIG
jgi:peptidylprolyl isomerase